MSRDLLFKPPVPIVTPEESVSEVKPGPKPADKLGTKTQRGRDLGGVGTPGAQAPASAPKPVPMGSEASGKSSPAFKAAYFNQDTSGVRAVNLRQRNMQALRGGEGATDLKKIVIPPAVGIETPDPAQLRGASDLMGLDGSLELSLAGFLGRQSAWAKGKGVTVEMIKGRLAQLERMVEDRKKALARLLGGKGAPAAGSVTVDVAASAGGQAIEQTEDIVSAGAELVKRTADQAEGMHKRIAKMLGIKR